MYKATFFNGKTSVAHPAQISWDKNDPDKLNIFYEETIQVKNDFTEDLLTDKLTDYQSIDNEDESLLDGKQEYNEPDIESPIQDNNFEEVSEPESYYTTTITKEFDYDEVYNVERISSNVMQIKFNSFPHPTIEIHDPAFIQEVKSKQWKITGDSSGYGLPLHISIILAVTFLLSTAGAYFYAVPFLSHRFVEVMPKSYDKEWGDQIFSYLVNSVDINPEATASTQELWNNLDYQSDFPIKITIVDSPVINAFALPGGNIVIFTGLIKKMEKKEELIALIGHELGHVELRHSSKSLVESAASYAVFSLFLNDINGVTAIIAENLHNFHKLSYSRDMERDADDFGLTFLQEQHISAEGMVHLFERLQTEQGKAGEYTEDLSFLTTHPAITERIETSKKIVEQQQADDLNRDPQKDELQEALWLKIKDSSGCVNDLDEWTEEIKETLEEILEE